MHWLLSEGESIRGRSAMLLAARSSRFHAVQYLLEEQGASMTEHDNCGETVWDFVSSGIQTRMNVALSSLLKVMVMLKDAPAAFIAEISPQHAELCTRGHQLRAQLPSYLEQQRAAVVAHCSLPGVLRSVVTAYAVTTPEDMWADGLRVRAPRARGAERRRIGRTRRTGRMRLLCVGPFACARSTLDDDRLHGPIMLGNICVTKGMDLFDSLVTGMKDAWRTGYLRQHSLQ
jgi:hypothetical protein